LKPNRPPNRINSTAAIIDNRFFIQRCAIPAIVLMAFQESACYIRAPPINQAFAWKNPMAIPNSAEGVLTQLKQRGPLTAAQLGAALGISAEGARQRLLRLARAGLVAALDQRGGIGRPAQHWQLTASGQGRFPDSHAELSLQLIAGACRAFGDSGLEQLLANREQAMFDNYSAAIAAAATLPERVAKLAEIRWREGYMAHWASDGDDLLLIEDHCPINSAARACNALCGSELALFRRLLGAAAQVERREHIIGGARRCVYRISPRGARPIITCAGPASSADTA
jgi:predicted ArsR family transcriptional regulator